MAQERDEKRKREEEEADPEEEPGSKEESGSEDSGSATGEESSASEDEEWDREGALDELRSSWHFAATLHFLRLFQLPTAEALKKAAPPRIPGDPPAKPRGPVLTPEDLEGLLLLEGEAPLEAWKELVLKLIPRPRKRADGHEDSWDVALKQKLKHRHDQLGFGHNPLAGRKTFTTVSPTRRLAILHALVEWNASHSGPLRDALRDMADDPEALRHEPLGRDGKGARYYWFRTHPEDCRIFKEEAPRAVRGKAAAANPDLAEPQWSTACTSLSELKELADKLGRGRAACEKELKQELVDQIISKVEGAREARLRAEHRALLYELAPKKRSDRVAEAQARKDEEARIQKERAEQARQAAAERKARQKEEARLRWEQERREATERKAAAREAARQEREAREAANPSKRRRPARGPSVAMSREDRLKLRAERTEREGSALPTTEGMSEDLGTEGDLGGAEGDLCPQAGGSGVLQEGQVATGDSAGAGAQEQQEGAEAQERGAAQPPAMGTGVTGAGGAETGETGGHPQLELNGPQQHAGSGAQGSAVAEAVAGAVTGLLHANGHHGDYGHAAVQPGLAVQAVAHEEAVL